jgi:hypothetical protein
MLPMRLRRDCNQFPASPALHPRHGYRYRSRKFVSSCILELTSGFIPGFAEKFSRHGNAKSDRAGVMVTEVGIKAKWA